VLLHGGYAEALYFLTGEYQSYDKAAGAFGRVVPNQNLRIKRGCGCGCEGSGAWQVGVRFTAGITNGGRRAWSSCRRALTRASQEGSVVRPIPPAVHRDGGSEAIGAATFPRRRSDGPTASRPPPTESTPGERTRSGVD
jgi:hypothetical protein